MENINIYICLRNNETTIQHTFDILKLCETIWNITYFIYENDSVDSTKSQIRNFMMNRSGRYVCCDLNDINYSSNSIQKTQYMASVRNKVKNISKGFHTNLSNISVLLDSTISFSPNDLKFMVNILHNCSAYSMVTPYGHHFHNKHCYSDINSLETLDGTNILSVTGLPSIVEVHSAFGGLAVFRTSAFMQSEWDPLQSTLKSEHYSFCRNIRKHGKIVILTNIRVIYKFKQMLVK